MKNIILFICLSCSSYAIGSVPADTASVDSTGGSISLDGYLYSRYVWRGVNFGSSPSVQAQMAFSKKGFMAGCFVAKSLNGNAVGFSNTSNAFVSYQYRRISLALDDYFFYDEDNLDRYLDWSDTTLHFIETRLRYDANRWYAFVGANVYGARGINKDGVYIEAGYRFQHGITLFAGYLTAASDLNFMTSDGLTNIGITKEKNIHMSERYVLPVTGTLVINPSYEAIVDLPRVARSFVTLVIGVHPF